MKYLIQALKESSLFKSLDSEFIKSVLDKTKFKTNMYKKNSVIAFEGDLCNKIGIIINGHIEVQKIYPSGKTVTISKMGRGNIFGEVIIFSNMGQYPSSIISSTDSEIMFIPKDDIINLCTKNTIILNNFMELLSNKILMLNNKLKNISYHTIKEKLANFILEEYSKQNSLKIKINLSKKELAEHFGIPRPSLSRELINMKNDNIIDYDRKTIEILDLDGLEDILIKT